MSLGASREGLRASMEGLRASWEDSEASWEARSHLRGPEEGGGGKIDLTERSWYVVVP